jgi:hypothetical protein
MAQILVDGFAQIPSFAYFLETGQIHVVVESAFFNIRHDARLGVFKFRTNRVFLSTTLAGVKSLSVIFSLDGRTEI